MNAIMKPAPAGQGGVILIEAMVGILIFAIGIIALMGLQAAAIANTTDAKFRSDAAFLANQMVTQMWVDKMDDAKITVYTFSGGTPNASLADWVGQVRSQLPAGDARITVTKVDEGYNVEVRVLWQRPSESTQRNFTSTSRISYNSAT